MNFDSIKEKEQFTKTLLKKGLRAARREHLSNKTHVLVFIEGANDTVEFFGEQLTMQQLRKKYPDGNFLIINVKDARTKQQIDSI
jgi:hypothetical protein